METLKYNIFSYIRVLIMFVSADIYLLMYSPNLPLTKI